MQEIERRFTQLKTLENRLQIVHGEENLTEKDADVVISTVMLSIVEDAAPLSGKVYYWLYPFYEGNFLQLVAALGASGVMEKQKDTQASRLAFYKFFRTVPIAVRLKLGERLNQPELAKEAAAIQAKITKRKMDVQTYMKKYHSN